MVYLEQLELHKDINESRQALDSEQAYVKRSYGREKEQISTLDNLGLDEIEAVEYVLMLSRDEEEARIVGTGSSGAASAAAAIPFEEEGVFEADFEDDVVVTANTASVPRTPPQSVRSSPNSAYGRSLPRTSPSMSNHKVQISPRFRPEPTEAGFSISPLNMSNVTSSSTQVARTVSSSSIEDFPTISPTPSDSNPSTPPINWVQRSNPEASRTTAWGSPKRSTPSSEAASPGSSSPLSSRRGSAWSAVAGASHSHASVSLLSEGLARHANMDETAATDTGTSAEDDDLRLAIELSLAEARSRVQE